MLADLPLVRLLAIDFDYDGLDLKTVREPGCRKSGISAIFSENSAKRFPLVSSELVRNASGKSWPKRLFAEPLFLSLPFLFRDTHPTSI